MKKQELRIAVLIAILTLVAPTGYRLAEAQNNAPDKSGALVFDPETKKYFTGGSAKFSIKQTEGSGLVDRIEVSVDGGDYQAYNNAIQFQSEGKHTLKFRAINPVNNWSPVQFTEVFVDLTAPTTEAKFDGDKSYRDESGTYASMDTTVTLNAQDNLSGVTNVEYSWDGQNYKTYSKPIKMDRAGKKTLHYRATDRVGNMEVAKTLDFTADGASPYSKLKYEGQVKQATIQGKSYLSASDSVAFSLEAGDDATKIKNIWVMVDNQPAVPYQKPIYFLQEGPHTMKYFAEDVVGNKEEPKTIALYIVSVPPRTSASVIGTVVNTGGINFAKRDFQLKLEATENAAGLDRIEIKLDNEKDFHAYVEPIRFKAMGQHTVAYRAVDRAGNAEPAKTYSVNIHETAPETTLETAQPLVTRNGINYSPAPNVITLSVKNSVVGIDQTYVSTNDAGFTAYTGPITLNADQKVYKLAYKSIDKLGNEEATKTVTYHMISNTPIVDLFISNGQNSESQVRTNYFDQPGTAPAPARVPASKKKK